jgi:hypothetical protein
MTLQRPGTLTVAVQRWPLATATRRPNLRLGELLWRPPRRFPDWLGRYLLVELPVPMAAPPTVPSLFGDGPAIVPSCLAVQGVLAALHGASQELQGWARSKAGRPAFSWHKPGGSVTTSVRAPLWGEAPPDRSPASAWEVAHGLDDLDGDVLLIALAHALARVEPDSTTWITADAILDERGIQPKTERVGAVRYRAGHRREDRRRVAACMERLGRLWVDLSAVAVMESHSGRPHRGRRDDGGALFIISDRLVQGEGAEEMPVAWRYRPGPWLSPFLSRPNRQTAPLARAVLRYDPYHERWEKRLGRYLTFHLRMDARRAGGQPLVRRIGRLLDELHLPVDRRHPERSRARCEAALDRLARDGVIGGWGYTATAHASLAALPARRWLELWRDVAISITPHRYPAVSPPEPDGIVSRRTAK